MNFKSKVGGKTLNSQAREVISNVLEFAKSESASGELIVPITKVQIRVAIATGVSERTVRRIMGERNKIITGQSTSFVTPTKTRKRSKSIRNIDNYNKSILKRIILNIYTNDKVVPTVNRTLQKFKKETGFSGSRESLRAVIPEIGFHWRKVHKIKRLMERHIVRSDRINYLRSIKSYRAEGRPIFYMNETSIFALSPNEKGLGDDTKEGILQPATVGPRYMMVLAGGDIGFVPDVPLIFKTGFKTGNDDITFDSYKKWLEEELIPSLPERSVLVIDNAPYHNMQTDKTPTFVSKIDEIKDWLRAHNIVFDATDLKPQLYDLVLQNKPKFKKYAVNKIMLKHKHEILRLPPYHHDLNPMELAWASFKEYVAHKDTTNLEDVQALCEEFFGNLSAEKWKVRIEHAKNCEKLFLKREADIDAMIESFIVNPNDDSESSDGDVMESDEGDDSM